MNIDNESIYWFCAFVGTGIFFVQFILTLFGAVQEDLDDSGLLDASKFKWMSRQAITGFLMMFGWTGVTCSKEFGMDSGLTMSISIFVGLLTIGLTGILFRLAGMLHSTGNVFRIEDAIGKEALIYQNIPKNGLGKITISMHDHSFEIDATAVEEISSFTRVKVVKKMDDTTVVVTKI